MKTKLTCFLLFGFLLSALAADRITLTLTVTNLPITGDDLTVNSAVRYWTNLQSASCFSTNTNTLSCTTNLFNAIAAYPYADAIILRWTSPTGIMLTAQPGNALAASETGGWADLVLSTQTLSSAYVVRVPNTVEATTAMRTNIASMLASYLDLSTNALATNSPALTNYLTRGSTTQYLAGEKVFTTLSGGVGRMTNGYWANGIANSLTLTNGTNYGLAFSSPGSGTGSEQLGGSSEATGNYSLAVGANATASGVNSIAIGFAASATTLSDIIVGTSSEGGYGGGFVFGTGSAVGGTNSGIFGNNSLANYSNCIVIGNALAGTAANQVMLGGATYTATIPGVLSAAAQTNSTFKGTNSFAGGVALQMQTIATIADGNNTIAIPDTATYIYLSGAPSGLWTNCSMSGTKWGGRVIIIENGTGQNGTIAHESGFDGTAANRIYTRASADVVLTGRACWTFIYNATSARWILMGTN